MTLLIFPQCNQNRSLVLVVVCCKNRFVCYEATLWPREHLMAFVSEMCVLRSESLEREVWMDFAVTWRSSPFSWRANGNSEWTRFHSQNIRIVCYTKTINSNNSQHSCHRIWTSSIFLVTKDKFCFHNSKLVIWLAHKVNNVFVSIRSRMLLTHKLREKKSSLKLSESSECHTILRTRQHHNDHCFIVWILFVVKNSSDGRS